MTWRLELSMYFGIYFRFYFQDLFQDWRGGRGFESGVGFFEYVLVSFLFYKFFLKAIKFFPLCSCESF